MNNITDTVYDLGDRPFEGTGHVVFNHSLYYQEAGTWTINRYDFRSRQSVRRFTLHYPAINHSSLSNIYNGRFGATDFAVDEEGLWIIYSDQRKIEAHSSSYWNDTEVFFLSKLDPILLQPLKIFRLNVPINYRGSGFLICGTLYIVRHGNRRHTSIAWAFDAFTQKELNPRILFSNPYGDMKQLHYDPRKQQILAWDTGRIVTYPLLLQKQVL